MRDVVLAVVALALSIVPALAHDPDTGEPNWITEGGYTSPDTGVHCCGPNDCERLDPATVQVTPRGYVLHGYDDEVVPFDKATPSEDGHYWRCFRREWEDGKVHKMRRCFFAPVGTE
jgi:hypothetical protein